MFAIGHTALGYMIGKIISKATGQNQNIPALLTLSLLPDIDFLIPGLQHRGPTHSFVVALIIFIPLLLMRTKKSLSYFAALASHSLIGDCITDGGIQLFWPISSEWVNFESTLRLGGEVEIYIELALFGIFIITLILSKDFNHLFNADKRNNLLLVPLCTIVLPIRFKYPVDIPRTLLIPHIFLLSLITLSISISLIRTLTSTFKKRPRMP